MRLILFTLLLACGQFIFGQSSQALNSVEFETQLEQARSMASQGQLSDAYQTCQNLIQQLDTLNQQKELAALLTLQGTIARAANQLPAAVNFHKRALKIRLKEFGGKSQEASSSFLNLGNCELQADRYKSATEYFLKGISIKKDLFGENSPLLINNLNSLATCYEKMGQYRKARDTFYKTIKIAKKEYGENGTPLINLWTNLSNLYLQQSMTDSAIYLLEQAKNIQIDSIGNTHPATATLWRNLATAFQKKGQFIIAENFYNNALNIYDKLKTKNPIEKGECLQSMGICFLEKGDARSAILYLNAAKNEFKNSPLKLAGVINNIGLAHLYMGAPEEAENYFNRAINYLYTEEGELTDPTFLAGILQNLGTCHLAYNDPEDALTVLGFTKKIMPQNTESTFDLNSKFVEAYTRLNDLKNAKIYLQKLKSDLSKLNPIQEYTYYYLWGNILTKENNFNDAAMVFLRARGKINNPSNEGKIFLYENIQINSAIANVFAKMEDWGKALSYSMDCIEDIESLKGYLKDYRSGNNLQNIFFEPYFIAAKASFINKQPEKAFYFSEKYRHSFLQQLNTRAGSKLKNNDFEIEISELKKERFLRTSDPFGDQNIQTTGQLDSAILALTNLRNKSIEKNNQTAEILSLSEIQNSLSKNESLLQYQWGTDEVILFLVQKNNFKTIIIPHADSIENKIGYLYELSSVTYNLSRTPNRNTYKLLADISHELFKDLIQPVLPIKKNSRLIIVPDGPLCYLPFSMLLQKKPDEPSFFRSHDYLIRDYDIQYLHAASLIKEKEKKKKNLSYPLLSIAPTFKENSLGLTDLQNNVKEVETITENISGKTLKEFDASENIYLKNAAKAQVIHFSTHGILNDRAPEFSFLAFTEVADSVENEQLFVSEITNQNLAADLVVLSACQTASGRLYRGEGLASIAQGFLLAGAESLVASLWNVDDQQTPELMGHFYDGLKEGMDKSAALRKAQLAHLEQATHKKAHPYYWAGFVQFGENNPLEFNALSTNDLPLIFLFLPILLVVGVLFLRFTTIPMNKQN